jgi:hypothetical protein
MVSNSAELLDGMLGVNRVANVHGVFLDVVIQAERHASARVRGALLREIGAAA